MRTKVVCFSTFGGCTKSSIWKFHFWNTVFIHETNSRRMGHGIPFIYSGYLSISGIVDLLE